MNEIKIQEDEIDVRELFRTLIKNKTKIISITLFTVLLAVVYLMLKTPIYEVKSNVQIGFTGYKNGEALLLDNPSAIAKKLNVVFEVSADDKTTKQEEFISEVISISQNKKVKNYIEIKTEGISNDEALQKNKEVLAYLEKLYDRKIDLYTKNIIESIEDNKRSIKRIDEFEVKNLQQEITVLKNQKIKNLEEKINFLKVHKLKSLNTKIDFQQKKLKEYRTSIDKLYNTSKKSTDVASVTISSLQMLNYQTLVLNAQNKIEDLKISKIVLESQTIPDLERQKNNLEVETLRKLQYELNVVLPTKKLKLKQTIEDLEYKISGQNLQNSTLVGKYVVSDNPSKPKKKLILIISFITGFLLSIFLVFFLEFIRGFKEEIGEEK